jgi:glyoxylase-like metal-dependent hydrolase (beta-lactamase superfamily II)
MGGVNVWLLQGEPLTLVDTGPATEAALASLEDQLAELGVALEDIQLVVLTHHHLDHTGLAATIRERSGAQIVAHGATARYGARFHAGVRDEQAFALELIAAHGVPNAVITGTAPFFAQILAESRPFTTDRVLLDGDTIRAGGRRLRVVHRPGHSTTDTLFVDDDSGDAFVVDHLLANITSGVELGPTELPGNERRRGLMEYLGNLRKTQVMPLRTCWAGHGPVIHDHSALIEDRLGFHADRLERIRRLVAARHRTAYAVARELWSDEIAEENPVLVVWEVLGHFDLLVNRGLVTEEVDARGRHTYFVRERAKSVEP